MSPGVLWAATGSKHLDLFLDNLGTLQANFEQSVLDDTHSKATRFQGVLYLRRPGQFRWDYSEPYEQLIVADGNRIWVYDSDLEQVSHSSQEDTLKGTPAQLLSGTAPVEESFEVIDIGESQGMEWVELIPRDKESQFIRILLAFMGKELRRMEMADQFGQITRFQFTDIQRNLELPDKLFEFEMPEGVDSYGE
ncbi:Outer membrane lipoprotein carrier protein LolA [hydrothermal vent metagenome]|uniref:Outer-membrane lipoprotein carrier protein n=1 Tax=hydrothermal vent metagenome TaxID=652676 RepID=A0A3B1ASP8_9ZZZZ